jgi:hypothetical protein
MYPVRLGFAVATSRINSLLKNGHDAEALVTAVFTVEKTLRRTLRQLVVSAGFISRIADKISGNLRGLDSVKNAWEIYDPKHRKLLDLISAKDWNVIKDAAEMRNKLVHGERVYALAMCRSTAKDVLVVLGNLKMTLEKEYGYSGWVKGRFRRTSQLHKDPKVLISP